MATKPPTHIDAPPTPTQGTLDSSHPLYLHPAENAGFTLLPVVFHGTGYRS